MNNRIDHATLSKIVEARGVQNVVIEGTAGGWVVLARIGLTEQTLIAKNTRQPRVFKRFATLVKYLREMGIVSFTVNAAHYSEQDVTKAAT